MCYFRSTHYPYFNVVAACGKGMHAPLFLCHQPLVRVKIRDAKYRAGNTCNDSCNHCVCASCVLVLWCGWWVMCACVCVSRLVWKSRHKRVSSSAPAATGTETMPASMLLVRTADDCNCASFEDAAARRGAVPDNTICCPIVHTCDSVSSGELPSCTAAASATGAFLLDTGPPVPAAAASSSDWCAVGSCVTDMLVLLPVSSSPVD
mmetsp:Transcript_56686/g.83194  ORF Transcript_56686/g.83194 Transcript_56686/m.83194 type:complete len:206 (+) Transcript_56686:541-1158(+)